MVDNESVRVVAGLASKAFVLGRDYSSTKSTIIRTWYRGLKGATGDVTPEQMAQLEVQAVAGEELSVATLGEIFEEMAGLKDARNISDTDMQRDGLLTLSLPPDEAADGNNAKAKVPRKKANTERQARSLHHALCMILNIPIAQLRHTRC